MGRLSVTLKVRLDAETLAALERQAAVLERPASQLARKILREHLAAAGELVIEAPDGQ